MEMSNYIRLTRGLNDRGLLIKPQEIQAHVKNDKIDHYFGLYNYNKNHLVQFLKNGSVAGIKDVLSNQLWFDFDSPDLKEAQKDALELLKRFQTQGFDPNHISIHFSGNKGFNVILSVKNDLTPEQVKYLAVKKFGVDLKSLDPSMYDAPQLLRVPRTRHPVSGLYKIPLTYNQLLNLNIEKLKEKAAKNEAPTDFNYQTFELSEDLLKVPEEKENKHENEDLDLTKKPRQWKASKWALLQGFINPGERNNAMMILSSTCKAMGFDKITSYYMCKSALERSWERFGEGNYTKEELWSQIERVFSDSWNGGQYSEKNDLFLQKKAEELDIKELTTSNIVGIKEALKIFKGYAKNIDELTLKTGIKELDEKQRITVGMAFGIVASPGSGKTALALKMLHSMSKNNELCIFFSYDMYAPLIIQRIIQKHWKEANIEQVFDKYKAGDQEYVSKVEDLISKEYPNVEFCFETGQTIEEVYQTIHDAEQKTGKKCKFVVVDYNELIITDVGDPTQSSNQVAQGIRALAQKEQLCVLSLFQPSKITGDPSQEIMSYRAAKGGSGIEQSLRLMLGVSRPGYDANNPLDDNFLNLKVLKNNMGPIFSVDLYWDGYKGEINSLTSEQKNQLRLLRDRKSSEKNGDKDKGWEF